MGPSGESVEKRVVPGPRAGQPDAPAEGGYHGRIRAMSPARRAKRFLPALAGFGAFCPKETPKPAAAAHAPELKLAPLSAQLSEPGGYFDSDNLISNETSYLQVAEQLADQ